MASLATLSRNYVLKGDDVFRHGEWTAGIGTAHTDVKSPDTEKCGCRIKNEKSASELESGRATGTQNDDVYYTS